MFKTSRILTGLLLLFCVFIVSPQTQANPKKQVIILLADYLNLNDLNMPEADFLKHLGETRAMGLMNTNTALNRLMPHTQASISAGRPAAGGNGNIIAAEANEIIENESARISFNRYTGSYLRDGEICILNWPQIVAANSRNKGTNISIGFLGDSLRKAGLITGILGNSDLPKSPNRPATLITTDFDGITSFGIVGEELLSPSEGFLPWRTNYEKLIEKTLVSLLVTDFLVIDVGDLNRLESLSKNGLDNIIKEERKTIIENINDFSSKVLSSIDLTNTLFIIASSTPTPSVLNDGNYLVPIILVSDNINPGLVYSSTTRREGLITNADLTATILNFLEVESSNKTKQLTGQPLTSVEKKISSKLQHLNELNRRLVFTYQTRPLLIKPYVVLQIITILLTVPLFFTLGKLVPYYRYWLSYLIAFPVALLFPGVFPLDNFLLYAIIAITLGVLLVIISHLCAGISLAKSYIILGILTSSIILLDLVTGSHLMKQSILGYDPIAGARYYGIGNEYMGVLIGSSFLGIGSVVRKNLKKTAFFLGILYFSFIIWLMFAGDYGTNFGGTMAIIIAFLYWIWRWQRDIFKQSKFMVTLLILFFIASILIGGLEFSQEQTHIGRAFTLVRQGGSMELFDIIFRKVQMNLKLIRYTNWSRVFLLALLSMGILFFKPRGFIQYLYKEHRSLYESFSAILVGSICALIFNDSGIVAASTAMIYAVYPLLSLALIEKWQVQEYRYQ